MKIYFDGGCVPNPGKRCCAIVSEDGSIQEYNDRLGYGTNNEAEWFGFLWAVNVAQQFEDQPIEVIGDSKLVIMQAQGLWKCNLPTLRGFQKQFREMEGSFSNLKLTHVRRHLNLAGIYIEKYQHG
jgi:ribonuclease HI